MSLLITMATVPGLLGTQEAIRQAQSKDKREEHRARRCNFIAHCIKPSLRAREINDEPLVLRDGRIFIDSGTQDCDVEETLCMACGYYLPYPDSAYEGLVTKISMNQPIMNWMYVDAETQQLRYGVRKDADGNITGPFDCTSHSRRVTLFKWEGWCAVEEKPNEWAVYFDVEDDGLRRIIPRGMRVLEIELERREARYKKEEHAAMPMVRSEQQDSTQEKAVSADVAETLPENKAPLAQTPSLRHKKKLSPSFPERKPSSGDLQTHYNNIDARKTSNPARGSTALRPLTPYPFVLKPPRKSHTPNQNIAEEMKLKQTYPVPDASQPQFQFLNLSPVSDRVQPRFQSLDLPRQDTQHSRRLSIDIAARKAFHRVTQASTSFFNPTKSSESVSKKKTSTQKRTTNVLRKKKETL
ncbi:hypothetical protein N0V90_010161 [Kalmusia sp. IMI 367209]|nr:hypothetical protein N0V90_010161 [Kalmusia sp. IMI 367209]